MKRRQATRSGTWAASSAATWSGSYSGAGPIDPISLNPYLYFDARVNVNTEGGDVDLWYAQWYGDPAPSNGLSDYLDQGTAEWKPIHSTDGYIQFDNVDTRLEYDPPVSQAGVLICATDNGIFAYEVDADSVDEITALGWEKGYFQTLKLYAMTLLPATVSDLQIAGVIQYFEEELGATRNPTGSLSSYWRGRTDIVTPKFAASDFSGVTDISSAFRSSGLTSFPSISWAGCSGWDVAYMFYECSDLASFEAPTNTSGITQLVGTFNGCSSLTSMPVFDTSNVTGFNVAWLNCSLTSFPEFDVSSGTNFDHTWYNNDFAEFPDLTYNDSAGVGFQNAWNSCSSLTSFPASDLSMGTGFFRSWMSCTSLENFPANFFDYWSPGTPATNCFVGAWDGCSSLTATSVENILNSIATSGVDAPASGPDITIDYDDGTGPPDISSAVTTLKACSPAWTITLNGVLQ